MCQLIIKEMFPTDYHPFAFLIKMQAQLLIAKVRKSNVLFKCLLTEIQNTTCELCFFSFSFLLLPLLSPPLPLFNIEAESR